VTRHAFHHQRELDNRTLHAVKAWPAATQHATHPRDALYWATMGGAKALKLDHKIGSITPGKQADLAMFDTTGMNLFAAAEGGDPVHAVVMFAEASDVKNVMIAGQWKKRDGKLTYDAAKLATLRDEVMASRLRMMREGNYVYQPAPNGPQPEYRV
jgi:5-methylthioadenosine/S-adenosylhomocysteine deaminase